MEPSASPLRCPSFGENIVGGGITPGRFGTGAAKRGKEESRGGKLKGGADRRVVGGGNPGGCSSARTGSAGAVLAGEARPATAGSRRPRGPTCGEQAGHVRARGARLPGAVAVCGVRRPPPAVRPRRTKGAGARRKAGGVGRRTSDNRRERRRVAGGVRGRCGRTAQTVVEIRQICAGAGNGWLIGKNSPRIAGESSAAGGLCLGSDEHGGCSAGQIGAEKVVTIW